MQGLTEAEWDLYNNWGFRVWVVTLAEVIYLGRWENEYHVLFLFFIFIFQLNYIQIAEFFTRI